MEKKLQRLYRVTRKVTEPHHNHRRRAASSRTGFTPAEQIFNCRIFIESIFSTSGTSTTTLLTLKWHLTVWHVAYGKSCENFTSKNVSSCPRSSRRSAVQQLSEYSNGQQPNRRLLSHHSRRTSMMSTHPPTHPPITGVL